MAQLKWTESDDKRRGESRLIYTFFPIHRLVAALLDAAYVQSR